MNAMNALGWLARWGFRKASRTARTSVRPKTAAAPQLEPLEGKLLLTTLQTLTEPALVLAPKLTNFGFNSGLPPANLSPSLPLFNPALGTLVDVRVTVNASVTGTIQSQNRSASSGTTITGILQGSEIANTPALLEVDGLNEPFTASGIKTTTPFSASAYTGSPTAPPSFVPPSGVTFPPLTLSTNPTTLTFNDPATLAFYTASASRSSVTATMSTMAFAFASAPAGNLVTNAVTSGQANVSVSYDYMPALPVPIKVLRIGVHRQKTQVIVLLSGSIDPATAQNTANYHIISPGPDRIFGNGDDVNIPIASATYNARNNAVTLIPVVNLNIHKPYELVVQYPGQATPTVIPFNHTSLIGFNYHGGRFFNVVNGHVIK